MKQAKRLFSILLAVALIIGSVAVAANAATPLTAYEGSVLTYSFATDIPDNGTNVKIGDSFKLYIYMQSNYVPGTTGSEFLLWSSGILNPVSSTNVALSTFTSRYNPTITTPCTTGNYPAGFSGTDYIGCIFGRPYSSVNSGGTAYYSEEPVLMYTIDFSVPDDESLIGKTVSFHMPAGAVRTIDNRKRTQVIYTTVNNSASSFGSGTEAAICSETVNVPTPLTLTIISNVPTIEYCDYAELEAAVNDCGVIDPAAAAYYDATEYEAWESALAAANALLGADPLEKTDENEATIADAASALRSAYAELDARYINLAPLESAIAICATPAKTAEYYDADDYATWESALAAAQAALTTYANAPATAQGDVNACAQALANAYNALVPEFVGLTALEEAIADCATPAKAPDYYDADDYAAWQAALAAAQAGVTTYTGAAATAANTQAVADLANALRTAFAALTPDVLDVTALQTAITNCTTPAYGQNYYDTLLYGAWATALSTANTRLNALTGAANTQANRDEVAALATDLTDKFDALVPRFMDVSALEEAVANCSTPAYAAEYYNATAYAEWQERLEIAENALTQFTGAPLVAKNQTLVNAYAQALTAAFAALTPNFVDLTNLNAAIGDCDTPAYAAEYYDSVAYATWQAALTAAQAGVTTYTGAAATAQGAVDTLETTLEEAFAALTPNFVDLSALEEAINNNDELGFGEEYYDEDDYAAWEDALAAAQEALDTYADAADTAENRQAIEDIISALETAAEAVGEPEFVDYSALEAALEAYGELPYPQSDYTEESYAEYAAALAAAQDLNENRPTPLAPASDTAAQQAINDAAAALEAAFNGIDTAASHILSVTTDVEHYQKNEIVAFDFVVDTVGTAKVQVIRDNGTTATYNRTHNAVTIVDNGNGTETWTINISIITDEGTYKARVKLGNTWENESAAFPFNVKTSKPTEDVSVISTAVLVNDAETASFTDKDTATLRVVTGKDTKRIRFVTAYGATITISTPKAVNPDGTKVWELTKKFVIDEHNYTVWTADSSNKLQPTETVVSFTVVKYVAVPSQGVAVYSASVAKTRMVRFDTQTFNVTTDKNATAVRLVDAKTGMVVKTVRTGAVALEDKLDWSFDKMYNIETSYNYKVEALYGGVWMASDVEVSFTVIY